MSNRIQCRVRRPGNAPVATLAVLWLTLAGVLTSNVASSRADTRERAEKYFRAGERAYKAGQYDNAARAFEEAYRLFEVPAIAFSTAQAYRLQYFIDKKPAGLNRALELYRIYVKKVKKGGRRDDAAASIAELEPIMLRLQAEKGPIRGVVAKPMTQLMISTQVEKATAAIDGVVGQAPLIREVKPGQHKIKVEAKGYFAVEQVATAVAGQFIVVEVPLKPKPAQLAIKSISGARIEVDGFPRAETPTRRPLALDAGKHLITVSTRGYRPWLKEVVVERGQLVSLDARLRRTTQRKVSYWVLASSGIALAASGISGGVAFAADRDAKALNDKRLTEGLTADELTEFNRQRDRRSDNLRNMYIGLGVGGALGAVGLVLYLFDEPKSDMGPGLTLRGQGETATRVQPLVGEGLTGVGLRQGF